MKKLLLTLLMLPASLAALSGPQPLYFSNITINPQGCANPNPGIAATANILATAAGGQPPYTYTLLVENKPFGGSPLTVPTASFANVPVEEPTTLQVTDSANNTVTTMLVLPVSQTLQIAMNIISLPLGNAPGCISLQVFGPGGKLTGSAIVGIGSSQVIATQNGKEIPAPFTQQFAAFRTPGTSTLTAVVEVQNDCAPNETSFFEIQFPFPQGNANDLKAYIFNKYCNCNLSSNTIPVS